MADEQTLKLRAITRDPTINMREAVSQNLARDYAQVVDDLPPIEVYDVEGKLYLTDGFHRFEAHDIAGRETIRAVVHEGTREDAERAAAVANARHGKPLTQRERRAAARRLLGLGHNQTQTAKLLSISQQAVGHIISADRVAEHTEVGGLKDSVYLEIGRVPQAKQRKLAEAAKERGWSVQDVRRMALAVNTDEPPSDNSDLLSAAQSFTAAAKRLRARLTDRSLPPERAALVAAEARAVTEVVDA